MKIQKQCIVLVVIAACLAATAGFFVGRSTVAQTAPVRVGQFGTGTGGASRMPRSVNVANGEVVAIDGQSLTVKTQDSGSRIVFISSKTEVLKFVEGATSDLVIGDRVLVVGTSGAGGSLTAESIQLNPARMSQRQQRGQQPVDNRQ